MVGGTRGEAYTLGCCSLASWEFFRFCFKLHVFVPPVHMSAVSVVAREGNRFSSLLELELQGGLWGCELPDSDVGYQAQGLWKSSNSMLAAEPPPVP